jgi:MoaA/NifB/PqqE/SkfB family radical SAM enzyme
LGTVQPEKWKSSIEEGRGLGCRKIQFIGSRPTVYPALPELIMYAGELGFEYIEVFTNGVSFSKKLKDVLVQNSVCLAFSFYSKDPIIHDKITKRPGSQVKTLENMKWALGQGLNVRANIVQTPDNEHRLEETLAFLSQLGSKLLAVIKLCMLEEVQISSNGRQFRTNYADIVGEAPSV